MSTVDSKFVEFPVGSHTQEQATLTVAAARDLLFATDNRFHAVLDTYNGKITKVVEGYFDALDTMPGTIIRAVRVSLNDYLEKLGIGLTSLSVEAMGRKPKRTGRETLLLPDEHKSPTLEVIPEDLIREFGARLIKFDVTWGSEVLDAVSKFYVRGFLPGENIDLSYGILPQPEGSKIIVPAGCAIGVRAAISDKDKAKLKGVNYREIVRDELSRPENGPERTGQVYWRRYVKDVSRRAT